MTVNYKEYSELKRAFFAKHDYDFTTDTSPMDQYGRYNKTYIFADGGIWYECMSPEYVTEDVEIKMAKVRLEVKMFRTEFFSTDDAHSRYYYEKF